MTEAVKEPAADRWAKRRKYWLQLVLGAVSGAAGMMAVLWLLEGQDLPDPSPSTIVAAGVAVIYILMGVLVGLGAVFPAVGAKLLNVQDRDDLMDQRAMLVGSGIGCALVGAAMLLLVFATIGTAPVAATTAFWLLAGTFVVTSVITVRQWPLYDEMMRAHVQESTALFGYGVFAILALWAAAEAADMIGGPGPLDLLSLMLGGYLLAAFIVISRRGMMQLD
jgi:hypothetical protein